MRIIHIGFHDTAGSMYFLCHAINKLTDHKAVSIRFLNDYLRWPAMIEGSAYNRSDIQRILYKADVIHFHIRAKPFFTALRLNAKKIREKKTLIYYHGSMLRFYGDEIQAQNIEALPDHSVTVSTPDLLECLDPGVSASWLPITRPFKEIQERYGRSKADLKAVNAFGRQKIVVFGHATTSVDKKGSRAFFSALTTVVQGNPQVRSTIIINNPWDACIRKTASFDIALASASIFPIGQKEGEEPKSYGCGYGLVAVEAGIFKIPVISLFTDSDGERYRHEAGEVPPIISWEGNDDLLEKMFILSQQARMRHELGRRLHNFMVKFHDEKPVVDRYLRLISDSR